MPLTRPVRRAAAALAVLALAAGAPSVLVRADASMGGPAAATPATADRDPLGRWTVTRLDDTTWRVSWRSPERFPVTSDRPAIRLDGLDLGVPTIADDGRTVQVEIRAETAPHPAALDVVLSGDRLDVAGSDVTPAAAAPAAAPEAVPLGLDPATPGPYAVVSSDYELDPVPVPGMEQPIEMVGHVVEPAEDANTGPRPLVVFLHGRHSYCYDPTRPQRLGWDWPCLAPYAEIPSHLGYDYAQQVLASQGFATVSIRVNGINAQDFALEDGGAAARAMVVRRHLDHWVTLAAQHRVDLSRVVLVGHSRGGEGVDKASLQIPLGAPYTIAGQVLLGPTNFGTQTAAYVPTVTVLPYCDGDVMDLQGQKFTDAARDLAPDDASLKSSVLVMGANHNYFNSEWTPGSAAPSWDDWWGEPTAECGTATPTRLTPERQRAVGAAYVAGAVRLFTRGEQQWLPMFDGSSVTLASTGEADVRSHAIGGGRELRRPGRATGLTLPDGATTHFCRGAVQNLGPWDVCGRGDESTIQTPHWPDARDLVPTRREFEMSWTAAGQSGGMVFDRPLDLTGRRLELRTIVDPDLGDAELAVRLTDADGASAVLDPVGGGLLPALPLGDGLGKRWAQALIVEPTGVDVSRVSRVDLVSRSATGRVWVLDLAAAPAALAPVPARRLPLVDLGTLSVDEGDEPTAQVARVPFSVTGDLTGRAEITVAVVDYSSARRPHRVTVDLSPGQTTGSVPVDFRADGVDDLDVTGVGLMAWAGRGVMVDDYLGNLSIRDDDPTPQARLSVARARVAEGQVAEWRVRLRRPVDYWAGVRFQVVAGPARPARLRVADLPRDWVRDRTGRQPATRPLFRAGLVDYVSLRPGRRVAELRMPIRRDGLREGVEAVTVAVRWNGRVLTRTIRVTD